MMTDPIADLLGRIRNAALARHELTRLPASKLKKSVAEILKQQQAMIEIARENLRRGEAMAAEPLAHRNERARVLVRRRRIHEHRAAGTVDDAEIAAEGGVPCKRQDLRARPPGIGEERCGGGRRRHAGGSQGSGHRLSQALGTRAVKRRLPSGAASMRIARAISA